MSEHSIDLNADLGEADDPAELTADRAIMPVITSCNIACGGHIGNAETMRATLELAKVHDVTAGAHPSYPDRSNFGRKSMEIQRGELLDSLQAQVATLTEIADSLGMKLCHIKPHGALYNDLAAHAELAEAVAAHFAQNFLELPLVGLAGGALQTAAQRLGLSIITEAFVDRRYNDNGHLLPRSETGAVLTDRAEQAAQAVDIALHHQVTSHNGKTIPIHADTLCLHGDTEGAARNAKIVRKALESNDIAIESWQTH